MLEERYLRRNPYYAASNAIRTIAKEGPAAPVFRKSPPEPWRVVRTRRRVSDPAVLRTLPFTEQFAIGYFTSAAGITIYRGNAYPADFRGNAFIGDVGGNLVHRKTLRRDGPLIIAQRRNRTRVLDVDRQLVSARQLRQRARRHALPPRHVPRDDRAPLLHSRRHQGAPRPQQRLRPRPNLSADAAGKSSAAFLQAGRAEHDRACAATRIGQCLEPGDGPTAARRAARSGGASRAGTCERVPGAARPLACASTRSTADSALSDRHRARSPGRSRTATSGARRAAERVASASFPGLLGRCRSADRRSRSARPLSARPLFGRARKRPRAASPSGPRGNRRAGALGPADFGRRQRGSCYAALLADGVPRPATLPCSSATWRRSSGRSPILRGDCPCCGVFEAQSHPAPQLAMLRRSARASRAAGCRLRACWISAAREPISNGPRTLVLKSIAVAATTARKPSAAACRPSACWRLRLSASRTVLPTCWPASADRTANRGRRRAHQSYEPGVAGCFSRGAAWDRRCSRGDRRIGAKRPGSANYSRRSNARGWRRRSIATSSSC